MSRLFNDDKLNILPVLGAPKNAFLSIVSNLEKIAIIEEGEGKLARNYNDLDLSNSIYNGKED